MPCKDCECENCPDECSGTDCTPEKCDCRNADSQRQYLLVIDPFVQTHFVTESSNEAISRVMVLLRDCVVGENHSAALHLVHHIRKPPAGDRGYAGDMMVPHGASSMLGEAHFVLNSRI